eukprot:m.31966 g.31966  ORF g.31966 m.31966 type:complete len:532 (+) comp8364_c0_seq2:55-1650(+)
MSYVPQAKIILRISCKDLIRKDVLSKSDPMCIVYMSSLQSNNQFVEIGRTERIKNTEDPEFVTPINVNYFFEEVQQLRLTVYDSDANQGGGSLQQHDFIGECEATLGEVVGAGGGHFSKPLLQKEGKKKGGIINVEANEVKESNSSITLHFAGKHLDKKDFFGKSDPYLEISYENSVGGWSVVHKTEVIKKTLDPTWKPFTVPIMHLCNGDPGRKLKFAVFDWDSDGSHDLIGIDFTTINELKAGSKTEFDLINKKKLPGGVKEKKGYKNSGVLHLINCSVTEGKKSFMDLLHEGLQLNFTVGIDFTQSNGDPRQPTSLHFISPYQPNEYVAAIQSVGAVIRDYDSDKLFPALGFGGKLPNGTVSHAFSMTGDETNPYCHGIEGIVAAYHKSIQTVQLWGPTNFAPIITQTCGFADAAKQNAHPSYFVLLIITDGVITDMAATKTAICKASELPISLIIIGVGGADFSGMHTLDADQGALRDNMGNVAARDVVQFVQFREHSHNHAQLAAEVLKEIPQQVQEYAEKHNFLK